MSDLAEILATVEKLRAVMCPEVSAELVSRILSIESEAGDDRMAASRAIAAEIAAELQGGRGGPSAAP